jgi:hypothetical protein
MINLMCVTSNQYSDAVSNMVKRQIYSDLKMELTNEIACYINNCIIISIVVLHPYYILDTNC